MKREIKFRAWDDDFKVMHPLLTINEISEIRRSGNGFGAVAMNFNWDQLLWLQFTGLHDKNGKEIYEGDIIKTNWGYLYKVVFSKGCFYGEYINETPANPFTEDDINIFHDSVIEIVGNLYENPELINKQS